MPFSLVEGLSSRRRSRRGATAIEYGLIAALIAVMLIVSLNLLGTSVSDSYDTISVGMDGAAAPAGSGKAGSGT